ncbi:MAG: hypothetical protein ACK5LS_08905, partial [Propioniciclava sp.]
PTPEPPAFERSTREQRPREQPTREQVAGEQSADAWPDGGAETGAEPAAQRSGPATPGSAAQDGPPPSGDPAPAAATGQSRVSVTDLRAMWPQVLDKVKGRRRVTWIVLRENAQVHSYDDDLLTLAVSNPGARESLGRGGSEEIVREALREVFGIAPRLAVVVESDAPPAPASLSRPETSAPSAREPSMSQPPATPSPTPSAPPSPGPAPTAAPEPSVAPADRPPPSPTGAARARRNIEATRVGPIPEDDDAATASRDDPDLDEGLGTDELLTTYLGAEFIGEEAPEP